MGPSGVHVSAGILPLTGPGICEALGLGLGLGFGLGLQSELES